MLPNSSSYAKKKKKNKKSSKSSKHKSGSPVISNNTTTSVSQSNEARSVAVDRAARNGGSSSSAQKQKPKDPDVEIEELRSNLLACLAAPCDGSVSYEGCFKETNQEIKYRQSSDCMGYINNASDAGIVARAKLQVSQNIKAMLKEACDGIGGKVSGSTCKVDIFYKAKSPDGKHSVENSRTFTVGQTVTCSYASFGLSQQSLEYQKEMSTEQKMALLNAGIGAITPLVQGGMALFQAHRLKKELAETDRVIGSGWFKFNGKSLENCCYSKKREYGAKKDLVAKGEGFPTKDSSGWYIDIDEPNCSQDECKTVNLCSDRNFKIEAEKPSCAIELTNVSDLKIKEKLSELIRTKVDLEGLKAEHDFAKSTQGLRQMIGTQMYARQMTNNIEKLVGNNEPQPCSDVKYIGSSCIIDGKKENVLSADKARDCITEGKTYDKNWECYHTNSGWSCGDKNTCSWTGIDWKQTINNNKGKGAGSTGSEEYTIGTFNTDITKIGSSYKTLMQGDETTRKSISEYKSTLSAYETNQNSLNEANKSKEELRKKVDEVGQQGLAQLSQGAIGGTTQIATSLMSQQENKGIMTGNCYIGSGNGPLFITDGETKKITWKGM